jgi:glycosyltransferase involved in cell wall biosynthesis
MDKVIFVKATGKGSPAIYSQELAKRLEKFPEVEIKEISTPLLSYREFFNLLKYLVHNRNTVVHFPFQYYAKFSILTKKSIITVHDMWWAYYPSRDLKPNLRDWIYSKLDIVGIKGAMHIITDSNYSKRQIIDYLHFDPSKISIVYIGVDHEIFKPVKIPSPIDDDYILYVGSEQPRKNLKTLLNAFKLVKQNRDLKDLKLVKVGNPETDNFRLETMKEIKKLNLENDVIFTGYVKDENLPAYYSNARCFVFPSLCEGFGIPTVEAMACGCPVITSNTSAFPEIVDDAGFMRDPFDAEGFAKDIETMITDDNLRDDFIQKGLKRAPLFSWDNAAHEMKKIYEICKG